MELRSLKLKDFLSHSATTVEFTPNRKLLIDGISGAGKTAIVEAIVWALFGRGRSENRNLVKKGKKKAVVDLSLVAGDKTYVIRRSVSDKGSQSIDISLAVDGKAVAVPATSIKEKQRYIEKDILKASYELFVNAIVWPQDNSQSFVKQTAAARKELLLEIVGTGAFDEYYDKAKEKLTSISVERAGAENELRIYAETIKVDAQEVAAYDADPGDFTGIMRELATVDASRRGNEAAIAPMNTEIARLRQTIDERRSRSEVRKMRLEERERLCAGKTTADLEAEVLRISNLLEVMRPSKNEYLSLKEAKATNSEQVRLKEHLEASRPSQLLEECKKRLASLSSEVAGPTTEAYLCPGTGNVCARAKDIVDKQRAKAAQELTAEAQKLATLTSAVADTDRKLAGLQIVEVDEEKFKKAEEAYYKLDGLTAQRLPILASLTRIIAIDADLASHPEIPDLGEEAKLAVAEKTLTKLYTDGAEYMRMQATLRGTFALMEQRKAAAESKRARVAEYGKKMADISGMLAKTADSVENLTLVKDALGSNGIKVVIVDTVLPKLEMRINEVLSELCDFRVKLDTQKTSASDEDKQKEGLFITVINGEGEELDYDGYSGGEKLKISVAITEALAELQNSSFRILDEMVVGLDAESVGQFSEILLKLQSRFSQIIAISHLPEVKLLFSDSIMVTKTNGTSHVHKA